MSSAQEINLYNISPYLRHIHIDNCLIAGYKIPWRKIYDYEFIFLLNGTLNVKTEEEEYTLTAGDIHFMPPFLKHTRFSTDKPFLYSMHFDLSYLGENNDFSPFEVYDKPCHTTEPIVKDDERLINRPYYHLKEIDLPKKLAVHDTAPYIKVLNQAIEIYGKKEFGFEFALKICIMEILKLVIQDMHTEKLHRRLSETDRDIITSIDYLNKNFTEKIDIDEFAVKNGFTPSCFRRRFKKLMGMPPNEYIIDLRIAQAINYMRTGMYSVSESAKMVGYDDLHYFSRLFKVKKGFAPSRFFEDSD